MPFLTRILEERWLLYIGWASLAVGLPLSRSLISIAPGILLGAWVFDGLFRHDFSQKWQTIRANPIAVSLLLIFAVYAMATFWADDSSRSTAGLLDKLPILIIALVAATLQLRGAKALKTLLLLHIAALVFSTGLSYYTLSIANVDADPRESIRFVNHIRLSLMMVFAILALPILIKKNSPKQLFLGMLMIAWFVYFMFCFQIATGLVLLMIIAPVLGLRYVQKKGVLKWLGLLVVGLWIAVFAYVSYAAYDHLKSPTPWSHEHKGELSDLGNAYVHDLDNQLTENGHYVWRYVARQEMVDAWNVRSKYNLTIGAEPIIEGALIRYLSSRGLPKDREGVMALSDEDIVQIEIAHPNYRYADFNSLRKRIYMLCYEVKAYKSGGDPSLSSLAVKLEYWATGKEILIDQPILGIGTGMLKPTFNSTHLKRGVLLPSAYSQTHQQFLSWAIQFGIPLGLLTIALFLFPVFKLRGRGSLFPIFAFYGVLCLSFLSEDTLENQLGLNLFLFYLGLFILPLAAAVPRIELKSDSP